MERDAAFVSRVCILGPVLASTRIFERCWTRKIRYTCTDTQGIVIIFCDCVRAGRYGGTASTCEEKTARGRGGAI